MRGRSGSGTAARGCGEQNVLPGRPGDNRYGNAPGSRYFQARPFVFPSPRRPAKTTVTAPERTSRGSAVTSAPRGEGRLTRQTPRRVPGVVGRGRAGSAVPRTKPLEKVPPRNRRTSQEGEVVDDDE